MSRNGQKKAIRTRRTKQSRTTQTRQKNKNYRQASPDVTQKHHRGGIQSETSVQLGSSDLDCRQMSSTMPLVDSAQCSEKPSKDSTFEKQDQILAPHSDHGVKATANGFIDHQLPIAGQGPMPLTSIRHKRLSIAQQILLSCLVVIVLMLIYALWRSVSGYLVRPESNRPGGPRTQDSPLSREQTRGLEPVLEPIEGTQASGYRSVQADPSLNARGVDALSLKIAENFYLQNNFEKAYAVYNQLYQSINGSLGRAGGQGSASGGLKDFLQLKMALCLEKMGEPRWDEAASLLRMVSDPAKARSPVVMAVANYYLSLLEMKREQFLKARIRAYQTLALTGTLTFDWQWTSLLQRDCEYLAAEAITRQVLSLCDADKNTPEQLWSDTSSRTYFENQQSNKVGAGLLCLSQPDPFINLSEAELGSILSSGCKELSKAAESAKGGPQIQKLAHHGGQVQWSVICNGESIEELLARFAVNADLDICWAYDYPGSPAGQRTEVRGPRSDENLLPSAFCHLSSGSPGVENNMGSLRSRAVSLYMSAATTQQILTVAAGCVGLLARQDDEGSDPNWGKRNVKIYNPSDYASLSQYLDLLSREAVSQWRRFLLTYSEDKRSVNAHFALGLLHTQNGRITDAIAEYKIIANRCSQSSLAPLALFASSKLKVNLLDYAGARDDLKQLVEQYPNSELADQAHLYLAETTMKAGLLREAAVLYRKVYNIGFSSESQRAAALGAGRCCYEIKDYENAVRWLTQFINLAQDYKDRDFYLAWHLLGKANLAQGLLQQACNAFENALGYRQAVDEGRGSRDEGRSSSFFHRPSSIVETVSELVKAYIQQGNFVEALALLEDANPADGKVTVNDVEFSQKESIEMMLLKANVLRSMGLVEEALVVLGDKALYLSDPQLKVQIYFEQAMCFAAKGDLELARKNLTEILVLVDAGPLAQQVGCELADICLRLGQDSQAISVCLQVLNSEPDAAIKQKALNLLASAFTRQKDYDNAALAFCGQWSQRPSR